MGIAMQYGSGTLKKDQMLAQPIMHTSGNWTWWEFASGLIIGTTTVNVSYTPSTTQGNMYRTASAVSLGVTPFSFSSGEISVMASQVQWAVNPNVDVAAQELKCYFMSATSAARTPTVHVIFIGRQ